MNSLQTNVGATKIEQPRDCTVLKIGGSLFDDPNLFDRIGALCEKLGSHVLIISGGGAVADIVRQWDRALQLGEAASHTIAIHAMGLGARLIAHGVRNAVLVSSFDECLSVWQSERIAVADPQPLIDDLWLKHDDHRGREISATWQFTSDSIAAWIGRRIDARRVVFGKSIDLADARRRAAAVDGCLPQMVDLPPLSWCNMRDDSLTISPFELPL